MMTTKTAKLRRLAELTDQIYTGAAARDAYAAMPGRAELITQAWITLATHGPKVRDAVAAHPDLAAIALPSTVLAHSTANDWTTIEAVGRVVRTLHENSRALNIFDALEDTDKAKNQARGQKGFTRRKNLYSATRYALKSNGLPGAKRRFDAILREATTVNGFIALLNDAMAEAYAEKNPVTGNDESPKDDKAQAESPEAAAPKAASADTNPGADPKAQALELARALVALCEANDLDVQEVIRATY